MKEFDLNVTEQELNIISNALGNMPFSTVAALVAKLQTQVNKQIVNKNETE